MIFSLSANVSTRRLCHPTRVRGFTLVELLILIAIFIGLGIVVTLVIDPAEILRKERDTQRISDLLTLKSAIAQYVADVAEPNIGNCTAVYATHAGAGNVIPPCGIASVAATVSATPMHNDGTGWIPINFVLVSTGAPVSFEPFDPTNRDTLFYRYACKDGGAVGTVDTISACTGTGETKGAGMRFELDAALESKAYTSSENLAEMDGGNNSDRYEVGVALNLLP